MQEMQTKFLFMIRLSKSDSISLKVYFVSLSYKKWSDMDVGAVL